MTHPTRVCQFVVEVISRKICYLFDSEMMVYAQDKTVKPLNHTREAKKLLGEAHFTLNASDDASRWNQSLAPNKIALCMAEFAPEYLRPLIYSVISPWENKQMKIPEDYKKFTRRAMAHMRGHF